LKDYIEPFIVESESLGVAATKLFTIMEENYTIEVPPDALVNFNLAVAIIFTFVAPVLNAVVVLPAFLLKSLRSKPFHHLVSSYLLSSLAIVGGFGFVRVVQICRYKEHGYEVSADMMNCGAAKLFEFPLATSNFCIFFLGFERYLFLKYKKEIGRYVLSLLILVPWGLGFYRHVTELATTKDNYKSIPYVGLCIDVSSEKKGKETITDLVDYAIPFLLAIFIVCACYGKGYRQVYKMEKRLQTENLPAAERAELCNEQTILIRTLKTINIVAGFLLMRILTAIVVRILFTGVENDNTPQNVKDRAATAGVFFLLFNVVIDTMIVAVLNTDLHKAIAAKFRRFIIIPWIHFEDQNTTAENTDTETLNVNEFLALEAIKANFTNI